MVLDDPFCSLDGFRRASTKFLIAKLANLVDQVIVLSHDPYFLAELEEESLNEKACLQAVAVGDSINIASCNLDSIIEDLHDRDVHKLTTYLSQGEGEPQDVARAIRPVIEGHLRKSFPNSFGGKHTLGQMIKDIRQSNDGDVIHSLMPHVDELDDINKYTRKIHHSAEGRISREPIDLEQLRGYAERTLSFLGGCQ